MKKGFTLIELSLVLMVLGILLGMGLEFATPLIQDNNKAKTLNRIKEIENALTAFYKTYGYLPCPASNQVAISNSGFGESTDCSTASATGTDDILTARGDDGNNGIRIGMVPVKTLGLPRYYAIDAYDNRVSYAVIKGLAQTDTLYDAYDDGIDTIAGNADDCAPDTDSAGGADTNGIITINNSAESQATAAICTNVTAYVIVSHGKDGLGTRDINNNVVGACSSTNLDKDNCDGDKNFIDALHHDIEGDSNYFDDIIRWKTKDRLEVEARKNEIAGGGVSLPACTSANQFIYYTGSAWACTPACTASQKLRVNASGNWACTTTVAPAFAANRNGADQTVTAGVEALMTWEAENYDSNSNFDLATERFTPTVPGKYLLIASYYASTASSTISVAFYKNNAGANFAQSNAPFVAGPYAVINAAVIVDMNGTTDFVDVRATITNGTTIEQEPHLTFFKGILISPTY